MIYITHFPKVKDKATSNLANKGQRVSLNSFEEAFKFISDNAVAPSTFAEDKRKKANFETTQLMMLDIDNGTTLKEAQEILNKTGYGYGIYTSVSNGKEKNGLTCDRYRVVLELDDTVKSEITFKETANTLFQLFPTLDKACLETARYFLGNKNGDKIFVKGNKYPVQEPPLWTRLIHDLGVGRDVKNHLTNFFQGLSTGYPGTWNNEINKAAYTLARADINQVDVIDLIRDVAPQSLDDNDLKTLQSGYNAGKKAGSYKLSMQKDSQVDVVEKFIKDLKIQKTPKGLFIKTEKFELDDLVHYIYCELSRKHEKISPISITMSLKNWYRTIKDDNTFEKTHFNNIKFEGKVNKDSEIDKAILAISMNNHELNAVALRHWIWQVKRKIFGKPVEHHMMLVLYGRSGSGKTVFLNRFLEPLKPFVLPADVSIVNDNREFHNFSENFAIFFDEMAHAARADVNKLKNIITCDTVSYRLLGKNSNAEHKNNASFIGASNTEIVDLIKDPTSARRYFQMNTLDKLDWDIINKLNIIKMFKEVDENAPTPVLKHLIEIADFQDREIRARDSIEEWLEVEDITFCQTKEEEGKEISPNDLYEMYADDQISQGKRLFHRKSYFFKKMKGLAPQFRITDRRFYKLKWKKNSTQQSFLSVIESEEVPSINDKGDLQ